MSVRCTVAGLAQHSHFIPRFSLIEPTGLVALLDGPALAAFGAAALLGLMDVFLRALLAEVQFFVLVLADDFGDVQGGLLADALLALHRCRSRVAQGRLMQAP